MILLIINNGIAPVIEGYLFLTICNNLLEKKFRNKYINIFIILEIVLSIKIVANLFAGETLIGHIILILSILAIIEINYKGKIYKKIVCYGVLMLIIFIGEAITMVLLITVTNKNISVFIVSNYYSAWAVIISKTIQIMLLRFFINKVKKDNIDVNNSYKNYLT